MQENERQRKPLCANFATFVCKTLLKLKKMDEFNYLQYLNDDNELLQVEDVWQSKEVNSKEVKDDFSYYLKAFPCNQLHQNKKQNNLPHTNV